VVERALVPAGDRIQKFTGLFDFTLDKKGRLVIPARIRNVLDVFGVTNLTLRFLDLDDYSCIRAYPTGYYNQNILGKLSEFEEGETADDTFEILLLTANAHDVKIDSQWRLNIPDDLLKKLEIDKEARIVGMGNFFDIWRSDVFEDFTKTRMAARKKRAEKDG